MAGVGQARQPRRTQRRVELPQRNLCWLTAALTALVLASGCATTKVNDPQASLGRTVVELDKGWQFQFVGDRPQATDSAWQAVGLPHSWNRLGEYRVEPSGAGNNERGIGWYRLSLGAEPLAAGK